MTKVSIITPTYNRAQHLRYLYGFYRSQTYQERELLIADDSPEPDAFFAGLADPTVKYQHLDTRKTIGWKRDLLIREASGDLIVHFDDDDFYSPTYLACAVRELENADLVKLTSWYGYDVASGMLFYCDMEKLLPHHYRIHSKEGVSISAMGGMSEEWVKENLWGYGFSYAFRRSLYAKVKFDVEKNWGEDKDFIARVLAAGFRLKGRPDQGGLSLHVIHSSNTSCVFPNYILPQFMAERIFGPSAVEYLDWLSRGSKEAQPAGPETCEIQA